ncbi:MAG TPA: carboxypeptidase-like regulatory domain-containing protein [Parapedobacter sp.]|uniref:TonB-dependent receptor n=1 Tax=Parapedobacter sp. TaxID=1958893 RepID=UPI002BA920CE|nr:carboxypeptidase-like regulatory domain-containing protein [Parapedobacter sp.]HWK56165.1 carboxypeptidase-like regulatory domain-containing protein [Parapedobacter sp.]
MSAKTTKCFALVAMLLLCSNYSWAQRVLTGKVTDREGPVAGATVLVKGTSSATATDGDGNFNLSTDLQSGEIVIRILGFYSKSIPFSSQTNLGTITLTTSDSQSLDEVVVIGRGIIDIAEDRETPIAVSTVSRAEILEKGVGNVEFPEIMKNIPSVFITNQAGGFGDSQNFLRGFDQSNTAYLLNGQPINGMEDGNMYWSNWSSIADIANAVQVQRGLGSSKLAISSVGGTVNIVTKATDMQEGGSIRFLTGNYGYAKGTVAYNTGLRGKWGFSFMLDYWRGDGKYAKGTAGEGQSYFFSVGYKPDERHNFNFMVFGAPQWHDQNYSKALETRYNTNGTINTPGYDITGIKGNSNYGYLNGEGLAVRKNYYHKPVANFNWDFEINEKSSLSTVLYASLGRGGGVGPLGNGLGFIDQQYGGGYLPNGSINWQGVVDYNATIDNGIGADRTGSMLRASANNHAWYGLVTNYNFDTQRYFTFNVGADIRFYRGDHFQQLVDKLGLEAWNAPNENRGGGDYLVTKTFKASPWTALFNPAGEEYRVGYDNSEQINYQGVFGQAEFSNGIISAFVQGAISNQSYQKFDRWNYAGGQAESPVENKLGYNAKAGLSFNFEENHTLFANAGFYSRQPFLDNVFVQNTVDFTDPVVDNEEILGLEAGYRFTSSNFTVNLNGYYTSWANRFLLQSGRYGDENTEGAYLITGITQLHKGLELDFQTHITPEWMLRGYASVGDWQYDGETPFRFREEVNSEIIGTGNLDLSGVKVGNAPQTSFGLGTKYNILSDLSVDVDFNFYDNLYGQVDPEDVVGAVLAGEVYATEKLDGFGIVDAGLSYTFRLNAQRLKFRGNVYNIFNKEYFGRKDGFGYFYGLGTTWNAALTYSF